MTLRRGDVKRASDRLALSINALVKTAAARSSIAAARVQNHNDRFFTGLHATPRIRPHRREDRAQPSISQHGREVLADEFGQHRASPRIRSAQHRHRAGEGLSAPESSRVPEPAKPAGERPHAASPQPSSQVTHDRSSGPTVTLTIQAVLTDHRDFLSWKRKCVARSGRPTNYRCDVPGSTRRTRNEQPKHSLLHPMRGSGKFVT